ncbi:uncharacterized protein Z519_05976 [Cladophialophora bantiana CBS 173.52]|uniref:WSC domain-containing protein n=1 Tax=Cladophialophora bantiana (strain ATCC 10958 / CBS 173.52 / CDC B-1940 / NIH 8579) TaxID=1442370 RepID=A0A0D2EU16_CLAB1|nr:uncharacterized protein Z519_05976 [Cladophialophora bantiana CBS 173.52]KIW93371.1 hypothetical protein Z519_05976 [Cladophialophora bantiana CBS 173.52]
MTAPAYLGAALCYDEAHVGLYQRACLGVNEIENAWQIYEREFDCTGILMYNFYLALVDGGETDKCVCKFENTGAEWAFSTHWGPCNGACVGTYTCDGNTPVLVSDSNTEVGKRATPSNGTNPTPTSLAVPLIISWKAMLCVTTIMLFNGIA